MFWLLWLGCLETGARALCFSLFDYLVTAVCFVCFGGCFFLFRIFFACLLIAGNAGESEEGFEFFVGVLFPFLLLIVCCL